MRSKEVIRILLLSFAALVAKGETFHFELDDETFSCDDGTELEVKLKSFNLNCIDGVGCDHGEGVLGAVGYAAEEAFPTFVHVLVHGCHFFDQFCPSDVFDGFVDICDSVTGIFLGDEDNFCSAADKESRFTLGIPIPHLLGPASPVKVEEVSVSMTVDDLHFCEANFKVTLEEGPATDLLAVGAPLVGVGVSALGVFLWVQRRRREINADQWDDKMIHRFEMMPPSQY